MKSAAASVNQSAVFRTFFLSYFLLILVPLLAFGILLYYYSVEVVADEGVRSNTAIMSNFSNEVEEFISLLTDDTIATLAQSPVSRLAMSSVKFKNQSPEQMLDTMQAIRELQAALNTMINTKRIIDDVYIVCLDSESVVRYDGLYEMDYFLPPCMPPMRGRIKHSSSRSPSGR